MTVLWSVLFLWSYCVHVTSDGTRKLRIKEVENCPTNLTSWEKASRDLNCTTPDRYQCTPNENLTALLEYCYHQPPTFVEKGYCWIISDSYFTDTYSCSGFKDGCPNITYRSNELYKYQQCLQLNKLEGCYLADPKCPSLGKVTTTPSTSSKIFIGVMISGALIVVIIIMAATFVIKKFRVCKRQEGSPDEELPLLSVHKVEAVGENVVLRCLLPINHRIIQARIITWSKDGQIINLKNATEKYSFAEKRQTFVIENADRLDIGEYVCCIKYTCNCMGMDENVTFKLAHHFTVSVSEDSKPMTSISWKRNGCDLILSDESENYSGGTLDDFCLRISHVKDNCFGTYECTARNVFGEMTIHITLECPSFTLGEIKTDGEDVIIEYTVSVSEDCKPMTSISWKRNGCDLILSDESENYSGGTPDDFFLRISHIKNDCFGTYECTVRNVFGEMTIHFTLECPSITLGEIKADGEDVEVEYAVSVSEDCKPMTSISWKRNGCDLILSDESENYSGGTLDDFCLRINHIKNDCFGTYECTVRNVFGEMTIHFTLDTGNKIVHYFVDDIQCRSRECQSFLLCCLLLDKCQPSKNKPDDWEEKLKISWKFCCGDDDKNITKRVLTVISDGKFEDHINCENNEYKLLSPDVVFQSFLRKSGFVDFFLQHACSRNISIYCRSAGYKKDPCETCCNVTPEQFKVVVQRLNFDILTNNSIKDKACHPIIEEALNIPKGILSLGSEGISKYLEELTHGDHVVFVARGMLVGCEGAGKTSLLRRLRGDDNPNPTSTRGIDVNVNVFTVDGGKLEVTTNPNKACLRSTLNQNDRTDVQNQTTNASANQLSGSFDFKDEKIEDEKISTKKPQTSYEINSKRVTTTIHQRYQRENKENGDSSVNDNTNYSEEDEIVTENILSLDFSIPTSDDTDIPHKISMEEILSESFADRGKIVTIFDFAGQFAYYACHHLYFSPNDFYILVMDITKRLNDRVTLDKTTQIHNQGDPHDNISDGRCKIERSIYDSWTYLEYTEYWLQSILTNSVGITPAAMKNDNKPSEQAPLILIATHAEEKTKKDVEDYFRDLRDKFPTMSVHIDYTNAFCTGYWGQNSNLDEIKNGIIKVVKTLPNWGKRIPLSWFYIETLLRKISSWKIIKTDQLLQRCGTSGVKVERKDDLITPLLFLHNTGVVLFFDEENLRDFIILDVQWFVDAFKNIITDENHAKRDIPQDLYEKWKMFNNNGLLTGSLLSSIWNKCEQNDLYNAKKTEIIAMMIKLNVLTEVTPSIGTTMSDMWYCPCMNKQTFPTAEFEKLRNSSLFCFKFNFLPKDLFHRLIAACSNKLKWKIVKLKFLCVYQTATVFDIKKSKVLIGMHSNDKILIQYLDLPESKSADYLGIREKIRKLIDELTEKLVHCAYEVGYMCEKNVFGKSNISLSHFIAGSDLEDTEEDGISCSECGFSRKISVTDIKWEGGKYGEYILVFIKMFPEIIENFFMIHLSNMD